MKTLSSQPTQIRYSGCNLNHTNAINHGYGSFQPNQPVPLIQGLGLPAHPVSSAVPVNSGKPGKARKKKSGERTAEMEYAEELAKQGKFAVRDQMLHKWNGSFFEILDVERSVRHALRWLDAHYPERANPQAAKSCIQAATLLMPAMAERDSTRTIIPVKNTYLEILPNSSIVRHAPDKSFGMTFALAITLAGKGNSYTPAPLPPESLLAQYLATSVPDVDVRAYLQELMGDTLSPSTGLQVATLLKGGGRNGKSVLVKLMSSLHERAAPMRLNQLSGFQLMPLLGASLVVVDEVPKSGFDEQMLKCLISGEQVSIDRKYLTQVSYRPTAKWIISTNNDQKSRDNSTGFWRRLAVVPFTHQVSENQVIPDGQVKFPHPWPPQIPPGRTTRL